MPPERVRLLYRPGELIKRTSQLCGLGDHVNARANNVTAALEWA